MLIQRKTWSEGIGCCSSTFTFCAAVLFFVATHLSAKTTLLSSSDAGQTVELRFDAGEYTLIPIMLNGESCTFIAHAEGVYTEEKGFPMLPYQTQSIIIPGDAAMEYEIVDSVMEEIPVRKIVPSKGNLTRDIDPAGIPYSFDNFYNRDEWYPKRTLSLGEPYLLNTVRGMVVTCFPFQYNPKSGLLRVTTSIVIRVFQAGASASNTLASNERVQVSPGFDALFERHFINYKEAREYYTYVADGDKMIVIATAALADAVKPLVLWKNQKGIATTLYTYPSETGGTGATALKSFIQSKFTGDKITYILLVGDDTQIPTMTASNGLSDPSYVKLNGSDNYPDAFIGRFSAPSTTGITAMVNKVLTYAKNPDPAKEWYQKATGIASSQGRPPDKEWMEGFRTKLMSYGYTTVDQIYDPGATATQVSNALNNGRSWVNYMGHGSATSWGTSRFSSTSVAGLQNTNMLPIIISVACYNGQFNKNCIAEAFTTATEKGALVFIGSSISMDWTPPQYAMQEMVEQLLTTDKCLSAGAIFYNGECKMLDRGSSGIKSFNTWIYFGDPSVMHFTKKPATVSMTYPQTLAPGAQQVTVSFGNAITGRVCLYNPKNGILGSKMISPAAASVTIPITVAADEDSILLTATPFNKVPVVRVIDVPTGPFLRVTSPSAGAVFSPGMSASIQWTAGGGASVSAVKIDYSTDGGQSYTAIIASTSGSGPYEWEIPDVMESNRCLVRVSQMGGTLSGISGMFTIKQNPSISLDAQSLPVTLLPNGKASRGIKISNSGKGGLTYAISSAGGICKILVNELFVSATAFFDGFELWNRGKETDLSGWKLVWNDNQSSSGSCTFAQGFVFKKNGTLIVMDDQTKANDSNMLYAGLNLLWDRSNTDISVTLIDSDSVGVDFVRSSGSQDTAPAGTSWQGQGIALSADYVYRASNDDNDTAADWRASANGTPNAINPGQSVASASWMTLEARAEGGAVAPLTDTTIGIVFDAAGLSEGIYHDTLFIAHNDPDQPSPLIVPCILTVSSNTGLQLAASSGRTSISCRYANNASAVFFEVIAAPGARHSVKIFDLRGHLLYEQAGYRLMPWRLTGKNGKKVGPGKYCAIVQVKNGAVSQSKTFIVSAD
ncbi:MAG: hypothetical protein JW768_05295 [Chitinispirillaceae bacterium]|nr:hypothetical protein [Chitinispirillaceae bacterium]